MKERRMMRPIPLLTAAVAVPLVALTVSACGGSDNAPSAAPAPKRASGKTATIGVAKSDLGKVLVDSQGRTIYLFEKDSGTKSACSGGCAVQWPPVRANGKPTVGSGLKASEVGTTARSDGKPQVTYNGHPLYLFVGDNSPGDTNGQGLNAFGARWFVLSPAGAAITASGSSSGSGVSGY
jgi:predicted lipoprotein with Yx(FWY)xxD motif